MNKAQHLKKGDTIAVVSLSSGILGEKFASHQKILGIKRLEKMGLNVIFGENSLKGVDFIKNNPEARAEDLKKAFANQEVRAIICAIGGEDTYKTIPYLMEDEEFINLVKNNPKIFTGYSDTTVNHLMFYKLGLQTFYGPAFLVDFAELGDKMLKYTSKSIKYFFNQYNKYKVKSSPVWYEERTDFSEKSLGIDRIKHEEMYGFEVIRGSGVVRGRLLGGCIESLHYLLTGENCPDQKEISEKYKIFPDIKEWKDKILFLETSEMKPSPDDYKLFIQSLKDKGIFDVVKAVLIGKPQDEGHYEEYKQILKDSIENVPIMYNINFGHCHPKTILPYNILTEVDFSKKTITYLENSLIKK